ncbi:hypothetical protein [Cedecea lapagei]|uniref:hypothetical protein n=1 Tax=Cedecea lapagei TaxID=158823 RepID=UPI001BCC50DD|nr:hypothetical protein [Cedecea lapagei]
MLWLFVKALINFYLSEKRNLSVNFNPASAKPVTYYKTIEIGEKKNGEATRLCLGYVNDCLGTGEPGLMVHGSQSGKLYIMGDGPNPVYQAFTPEELHRYLIFRHSLDLSRDKRPLHLLSCYSGEAKENSEELSVAQRLANVLQRRIYVYGGYARLSYNSEYQGVLGLLNNQGIIFKQREPSDTKPRVPLVGTLVSPVSPF